MSLQRNLLLAGLASAYALAAPVAVRAAQDPVTALATAICAAPNATAIANVLDSFGPSRLLTDQDFAEAFGGAAFMGELDRCANKQAIYDAFAAFKQGKQDGAELDAAFAMGHVRGTPDGGTASSSFYQGSFATMGTAGDPPSGK